MLYLSIFFFSIHYTPATVAFLWLLDHGKVLLTSELLLLPFLQSGTLFPQAFAQPVSYYSDLAEMPSLHPWAYFPKPLSIH